ncbi:Fic family protein, partial [Kocuria rhizophila]|uniref:Fic family protein n=1 Tax=Kocuria rhizophila TaxID=72000 RepID=UPI0038792DA1
MRARVEQASTLLEQVNYVHPFREGNGRTQRAYLDQIAGSSPWEWCNGPSCGGQAVRAVRGSG